MRDVTDQKRPELIAKPKSRLEQVGAAIDSAVFALAPAWGQKRIAARTKQRLIDRQVQRLGHPSMHPSTRKRKTRSTRSAKRRRSPTRCYPPKPTSDREVCAG